MKSSRELPDSAKNRNSLVMGLLKKFQFYCVSYSSRQKMIFTLTVGFMTNAMLGRGGMEIGQIKVPQSLLSLRSFFLNPRFLDCCKPLVISGFRTS